MLELIKKIKVKGISHITGGGFFENIPRSVPDGLCAVIEKCSVMVPPIFKLIQSKGKIDERDMFNTFNMGVGMSIVVPGDAADKAVAILRENGEEAYLLGEIIAGDEKIRII